MVDELIRMSDENQGSMSRAQRRQMRRLFNDLEDGIEGNLEDVPFGQFRRQFRGSLRDGELTRREFSNALDLVNDIITEGGLSRREARRVRRQMGQFAEDSDLPDNIMIPREQRRQIRRLFNTLETGIEVDLDPVNLQQFIDQTQSALSDGTLNRQEFTNALSAVDEIVEDGQLNRQETRRVYRQMSQLAESADLPAGIMLSDEQRENIQILFTDVQESVDQPPSQEDLQELSSLIVESLSDRTLTKEEWQAIVEDAIEIVDAMGVTPEEARTIFYDLQNIAEASALPRTDDVVVGTDDSDILLGGLGNDRLTGVVSSDAGQDDMDILFGGSGNDTFVLGDESATFYDDLGAVNPGFGDFATILDFNIEQDVIQLHGSEELYSLADVPDGVDINGTAIYANAEGNVPELVGVVVGVTLTDFNTGFSFA